MRSVVKFALTLLILGILYWPGIQEHWKTSPDQYFVPADAVQYIPAFFKYDPVDPIPTTYIKEYYLNAVCPLLYKWSLIAGSQLFDVRSFQLAMMYLSYAVFLAIIARLGWILGGPTLSFAVLALTMSAWIFIGLGFIGGAPRMYAYPMMAALLYALILDRPFLLAATVILGGLLYPIVALIGGFCLAGWLLLKPLCRQGRVLNWSLARRLTILTLTGTLTVAALSPLMLGTKSYGRRIVAADIATFPEAGPDGNYRPYDQLPYKFFGSEWTTYFVGSLYSHGDPILPWLSVHKYLEGITLIFVFALTGLIVLIVVLSGVRSIWQEVDGAGKRLTGFFAVCGLLHVVAWLAAPYLYIPTRYLMFSMPFLITLFFPWFLFILLQRNPRLSSPPKLSKSLFLAIIAVYLFAFGSRGNVNFADSMVRTSTRPLFDAIAALPKQALIAGWPVGPVRTMEYVTRRNVFLSGDLHQVLHLGFTERMRERMDAVFAAYFSVDGAPVRKLKEQFGVTHLIVETRDFSDSNHPPEYFSPWRSQINPRLRSIKGQEYLLSKSVREKASIFEHDGMLLLDLEKLP